jgi:hypothetical protein
MRNLAGTPNMKIDIGIKDDPGWAGGSAPGRGYQRRLD